MADEEGGLVLVLRPGERVQIATPDGQVLVVRVMEIQETGGPPRLKLHFRGPRHFAIQRLGDGVKRVIVPRPRQ